MSRIAINIPMLMATNPTQAFTPTKPSGVTITIRPRIFAQRVLHRAARRQNALLDANASSEQRQIERRERRRDRDGAKSEGQHGDLSGYQQIIRVSQIPEWAGLHEGCARQSDDARRPVA